MIITKTSPFTKEEIEKLQEAFVVYVKTVIDLEKKICSAGCNLHYDSEGLLMEQGSKQSNLWGGGVDLSSKAIDMNAMINIKPSQNNLANEILDPSIRQQFDELSKFFFSIILVPTKSGRKLCL